MRRKAHRCSQQLTALRAGRLRSLLRGNGLVPGQSVALQAAREGIKISQHSKMSVKKRSLNDPSESGKIDVYSDLDERVLKDAPASAANLGERPGQSIIQAAIEARDTALLRKIAAERKGLTDQQRQALLLVADLLDRAVKKRGAHA